MVPPRIRFACRILVAGAVLLCPMGAGCVEDAEDGQPDWYGFDRSSDEAVQSIYSIAVEETLHRLLPDIPDGSWSRTYDGDVVNGDAGTATVTGLKSHSESASSDVVSNTYTTDVSIVFSSYRVTLTGSAMRPDTIDITGNVDCYTYRKSTQSGLGFSSDENAQFSGAVTYAITDQADPDFGPDRTYCHGTVTFSVSGEGLTYTTQFSGSLTVDGQTYHF